VAESVQVTVTLTVAEAEAVELLLLRGIMVTPRRLRSRVPRYQRLLARLENLRIAAQLEAEMRSVPRA
jgi:hypothetical protein